MVKGRRRQKHDDQHTVISPSPALMSSLPILTMNPQICPPVNHLYGCEVSDFVVSPIFNFNGKPWQLRSFRISGKFYLLPVLINTGGSTWNKPIFHDNVMKRFNLDRKRIVNRDRDHSDLFEVISPLGKISRPLEELWPETHRVMVDVHEKDLRFNLFGHELAQVFVSLNHDRSIIHIFIQFTSSLGNKPD